MICHELVRTVAMDRSGDGYRVVFYRQPAWRRAVAFVYHRWERITDWALAPVDLRMHRRHRASCNDECSEGTTPSGQVVKLCGYLPLSVRRDCRCYELHRAGRTELTESELSAEQARVLGWLG